MSQEAYAELVLRDPDEVWRFAPGEIMAVNFENGGASIRFNPAGSSFYPMHRVVSYDFYPDGKREPHVEPVVKQCLSCDEPAEDSGEGRYCAECGDYEGTCINDHCLTCGART